MRTRRSRDEDEFETWLGEVLERADPFMAWLGILFALLVGYELAVELSAGAKVALTALGWAIWAVFALELAAQLYVAPNRGRYLRRHWFQLVGLVLPTLRVLRLVRLLRLGRALPAARVLTSSYRAGGIARRLVTARLGCLGAVSVVVAVAVGELAGVFLRACNEGDAPRRTSDSVRLLTTFGQAVPQSPGAVDRFAYRSRTLQPGTCSPSEGSVAEATVDGALALFEIPREFLQDRPLLLELRGGDRRGLMTLDV